MTHCEVIYHQIQNLHHVSNQTNFHQNHLINECARKKKVKRRNYIITDFFVIVEELTFLKEQPEI